MAKRAGSGETGPRAVTATIIGTGEKELVDLTVDAGAQDAGSATAITATNAHPFRAASTNRWVAVRDLAPGDHLVSADGTQYPVLKVERRTTTKVYNFTVAGIHTYLVVVGVASLLVHNCGAPTQVDAELARSRARGAIRLCKTTR
ncbi:polymorphic toxin-type HINT domain-containing protein [Saccharothrix sp. NPDC042600]|uniref:polymorphic toxin-type HINT domain-containing protein n=1 Tax=Saccharothrix TaxID=2071 RepID=UPI0033DEC605|nr:hypothetical protein GCM10017745_45970 [Saccharothrix mutabilis subsp. capreolus]